MLDYILAAIRNPDYKSWLKKDKTNQKKVMSWQKIWDKGKQVLPLHHFMSVKNHL